MIEKAAVETHGLAIGYSRKGQPPKIVNEGMDLYLNKGELTCLLGLNGAGKSTLLRTLCGFQPSLAGNVEIMGRDLASYKPLELALTLGVVLTEKTNAGGITVYELVSLGRHPHTGFFARLKAEDKRIIEESMSAVGILNKAGSYVSELSDGERQKAMIAKTLAQQCPVIILDEPTAFLDITSRIEMMILLRRLAVEQGKAILLSTHDLEQAIQLADKLWLMRSKPQNILCGCPEDLILNGKFQDFFARDNITFDISTGKMDINVKRKPVFLQGESNTVFWVRNALERNGYSPVEEQSVSQLSVYCYSPNNIVLRYKDGKEKISGSVGELIRNLNKNLNS